VDLAVAVLQDKGLRAVEDAHGPSRDAGGVPSRFQAFARRLHADHPHADVAAKGVKEAHGVAPSADAGDEEVRKPALAGEDLSPRLAADDALKIADHPRVGVGPGRRADDVVGVPHAGDPVAHGLIHGVFEGGRARGDGNHLRPEDLHPRHIRGLPADVLFSHEDAALHPEESGDGRRSDAMLAGPGLRDHSALPHPAGEESLTKRVVELMGARVHEVFPFEIDSCAAERFREAPRRIEGRLPACIVAQEAPKLFSEGAVALGLAVGVLQFDKRRHQGFRRIAAAEDAEMTFAVGQSLLHHISP